MVNSDDVIVRNEANDGNVKYMKEDDTKAKYPKTFTPQFDKLIETLKFKGILTSEDVNHILS